MGAMPFCCSVILCAVVVVGGDVGSSPTAWGMEIAEIEALVLIFVS